MRWRFDFTFKHEKQAIFLNQITLTSEDDICLGMFMFNVLNIMRVYSKLSIQAISSIWRLHSKYTLMHQGKYHFLIDSLNYLEFYLRIYLKKPVEYNNNLKLNRV